MIQIYKNLHQSDRQSSLAAIGLGQSLLAQENYETAIVWLNKGKTHSKGSHGYGCSSSQLSKVREQIPWYHCRNIKNLVLYGRSSFSNYTFTITIFVSEIKDNFVKNWYSHSKNPGVKSNTLGVNGAPSGC